MKRGRSVEEEQQQQQQPPLNVCVMDELLIDDVRALIMTKYLDLSSCALFGLTSQRNARMFKSLQKQRRIPKVRTFDMNNYGQHEERMLSVLALASDGHEHLYVSKRVPFNDLYKTLMPGFPNTLDYMSRFPLKNTTLQHAAGCATLENFKFVMRAMVPSWSMRATCAEHALGYDNLPVFEFLCDWSITSGQPFDFQRQKADACYNTAYRCLAYLNRISPAWSDLELSRLKLFAPISVYDLVHASKYRLPPALVKRMMAIYQQPARLEHLHAHQYITAANANEYMTLALTNGLPDTLEFLLAKGFPPVPITRDMAKGGNKAVCSAVLHQFPLSDAPDEVFAELLVMALRMNRGDVVYMLAQQRRPVHTVTILANLLEYVSTCLVYSDNVTLTPKRDKPDHDGDDSSSPMPSSSSSYDDEEDFRPVVPSALTREEAKDLLASFNYL